MNGLNLAVQIRVAGLSARANVIARLLSHRPVNPLPFLKFSKLLLVLPFAVSLSPQFLHRGLDFFPRLQRLTVCIENLPVLIDGILVRSTRERSGSAVNNPRSGPGRQ